MKRVKDLNIVVNESVQVMTGYKENKRKLKEGAITRELFDKRYSPYKNWSNVAEIIEEVCKSHNIVISRIEKLILKDEIIKRIAELDSDFEYHC